MSKGSTRRPCDEDKVAEHWPYDQPKPNVWPRDEDGNLIEEK